MRLAARHGTRTTLAWCVFAGRTVVAASATSSAAWFITLCLMLDILGCALLLQGVLYGTRQVYQQLENT